jgi:hypothetical protein
MEAILGRAFKHEDYSSAGWPHLPEFWLSTRLKRMSFRIKDDFRIRSQLAGFQPKPTDPHEIKRAGWQELGILVIDRAHPSLTPQERAFIENIGTKFYGRRNG